MFELMVIPFVLCAVLSGIYAYLGIHIIERQVIFVDLALAQIAALGAMIGILLGVGLHTAPAYLFSFAFALAGAAIFALTRLKGKSVPQEAVIGIVYVVTTSASIIVLSRSPSEMEHIKHMLVGNILFAGWQDVIRLAIICGVIGLFHVAFRKPFLTISIEPDLAERQGLSITWWDFLFYVSLGVVVTSSVEVAGVLLIFSYLVVPAACAMLLSSRLRTQLLLGWGVSIIASLAGLFFSAAFDLPTGAAIVCTFGIVFLVAMIASVFRLRSTGRREQISP
ncbi:MAG: metal ABC transporter permease [Candidatus Eisenbacteria bacterium]|nr:metal ABC transporter permease [Candidatus Eisenbacteria bacterium]